MTRMIASLLLALIAIAFPLAAVMESTNSHHAANTSERLSGIAKVPRGENRQVEDHSEDHDSSREHQHQVVTQTCVHCDETRVDFGIRLSGVEEVPPVNTRAYGFAEVQLSENHTALGFQLIVCHLANVTFADISVGAEGATGPLPVMYLYLVFKIPEAPYLSVSGCAVLSKGTLTASDLIARPESGINGWNDFVAAFETGNTYINVHTTANFTGEIRGQIIPKDINVKGFEEETGLLPVHAMPDHESLSRSDS